MTVLVSGGADPDEMPFSLAVSVGDDPRTVHLSGATAFPLIHRHPHDEQELRVPEGVYEQTVRTLENVAVALDSAGASPSDVVKVVIYNTRMDEQDAVNRAYLEFFGAHRPARTHVGVSRLVGEGLLVEIEVTAVVTGRSPESRPRY